jgi:Heterokaryon incompatibility protein (HET)
MITRCTSATTFHYQKRQVPLFFRSVTILYKSFNILTIIANSQQATAYAPLDPTKKQIRLLHLAPAFNDQDVIKCNFSLASFDQKVNYEALSYAWGDVTPVIPTLLKGQSVLITKNLHSALSDLRYKDQERILLADALCINQSDLAERTHQVSLMSSVYGRAAMVVIWLGDAWDGCKLAMELFEQLGRDDSLHLYKTLDPSLSVNDMGLGSTELRDNFIRFFASPWWKRLCKFFGLLIFIIPFFFL